MNICLPQSKSSSQEKIKIIKQKKYFFKDLTFLLKKILLIINLGTLFKLNVSLEAKNYEEGSKKILTYF